MFVCLDPIVLTISISSGEKVLSCEQSGDVEVEKGISRKDAMSRLGQF